MHYYKQKKLEINIVYNTWGVNNSAKFDPNRKMKISNRSAAQTLLDNLNFNALLSMLLLLFSIGYSKEKKNRRIQIKIKGRKISPALKYHIIAMGKLQLIVFVLLHKLSIFTQTQCIEPSRSTRNWEGRFSQTTRSVDQNISLRRSKHISTHKTQP